MLLAPLLLPVARGRAPPESRTTFFPDGNIIEHSKEVKTGTPRFTKNDLFEFLKTSTIIERITMKKTILVLLVVCLAAFVSCKKEDSTVTDTSVTTETSSTTVTDSGTITDTTLTDTSGTLTTTDTSATGTTTDTSVTTETSATSGTSSTTTT